MHLSPPLDKEDPGLASYLVRHRHSKMFAYKNMNNTCDKNVENSDPDLCTGMICVGVREKQEQGSVCRPCFFTHKAHCKMKRQGLLLRCIRSFKTTVC